MIQHALLVAQDAPGNGVADADLAGPGVAQVSQLEHVHMAAFRAGQEFRTVGAEEHRGPLGVDGAARSLSTRSARPQMSSLSEMSLMSVQTARSMASWRAPMDEGRTSPSGPSTVPLNQSMCVEVKLDGGGSGASCSCSKRMRVSPMRNTSPGRSGPPARTASLHAVPLVLPGRASEIVADLGDLGVAAEAAGSSITKAVRGSTVTAGTRRETTLTAPRSSRQVNTRIATLRSSARHSSAKCRNHTNLL